ncbi:Endonuclease/exonuclease/phosphatase, partial [Lactarius deliciosus]
KANINIATLNINGFTTPSHQMNGIEKWSAINRTLNTYKIAILAVQETHLDNERIQNILACFGRKIDIIASHNPMNPRASAGVAFVINKSIIAPKTYKMVELIPGRAISLNIKWHGSEETTLINIYAPNNKTEHPNFWGELNRERITHRAPQPNFLLGDFNITEDPIDRAPIHQDNQNAIEALHDLWHNLDLEDAWRHMNPKEHCFTYQANANGVRLDRIYVKRQQTNLTFDWKIGPTPVPTDHWIIVTKFAPSNSPLLGKGCWT